MLDFIARILYIIPVGGIKGEKLMIDQKTEKETMVRLKKIEGQVRGIQKMIADRRYCIDMVMQITAAESALHGVAEIVLKNHLQTCVVAAFRSEDERDCREKVDELMKVYGKLRPR
jgi:DNA-binding FrmR family transcriptional regulator